MKASFKIKSDCPTRELNQKIFAKKCCIRQLIIHVMEYIYQVNKYNIDP